MSQTSPSPIQRFFATPRRDGPHRIRRSWDLTLITLTALCSACGASQVVDHPTKTESANVDPKEPQVSEAPTGVPGIVRVAVNVPSGNESGAEGRVQYLLVDDIAYYPDQAAEAMAKLDFAPKSEKEAIAGATLLLSGAWPHHEIERTAANPTSKGFSVKLDAKVWDEPASSSSAETRHFLATLEPGNYQLEESD